jgi:hypothetical protein
MDRVAARDIAVDLKLSWKGRTLDAAQQLNWTNNEAFLNAFPSRTSRNAKIEPITENECILKIYVLLAELFSHESSSFFRDVSKM